MKTYRYMRNRTAFLLQALIFLLTQQVAVAAVSERDVPSSVAVVDAEALKSLPSSSGSGAYPEVTVRGLKDRRPQFLADVQGTRINAAKKASVINLEELPPITNNNYRQALVKTPGLLLSEESTPLLSIGYRGLEPHRAQFTQVLKDGVPIHADMFGYPEAYYAPIFQTIEEIEFIRGGASLMYGPQPGGALNYVTKKPVTDRKISLHSENVFGSDAYFSTYESMSGMLGNVGYLGYFHERQGDGFRDANSDYEVISGGLKTTLNQTSDSRLLLNYDEYHEEHGEPGGLTREQFDQDDSVVTRDFDRFRLERYAIGLNYQKEFDEQAQLDFLTYFTKYRRWSKRQRGGGFGTRPTGTAAQTNDIEEQDFYNLGFEPRFRRHYELFGEEHTFTAGTHTFMSHSPRVDQRGSAPDADSGAVRKDSARDTWYLSAFMENLFRYGKFKITPGVRLENIWQRVHEKINLDKTAVPLADSNEFDFAPLFGGGIAYEAAKFLEIYTNMSQAYRPKIFSQAVPNGTNQVVNQDLKEGKSWQYDIGLRGKPAPFMTYDVNYFLLSFTDQIGTVGNSVENVGDARHHGMEFYTDVDLVGFWDTVNDTRYTEKIGSLSQFITLTLLDAEFHEGANSGRAPQYTPQYNLRFGTIYNFRNRFKISLLSTFVDSHFADDASTANRYIPSYKVWDLTAELNLLEDVKDVFDLSLFGGINNIFDEHYTSRIRADGMDPANDRNIYGGIRMNLG